MSIKNPIPVPCACGCGQMTKGQSKSGFVVGHQNRGRSAGHRKKEPWFPDGTLLDDEDRERFSIYRWSVSGNGYLQRHHVIAPGKYTKIRLHQEIMGHPKGCKIDHINGNKLDNRRSNLRLVDDTGNAQNMRKRGRNTSGYRGVSWSKKQGQWQAYAHKQRKLIHLGFYDDLQEAARVATEYRRQHYKSYVDR